jgi:hypothetical protein
LDVLLLVIAFAEDDEDAVFAAAALLVTLLHFVGGCLDVDGWGSSSDDEADPGAARFLPFRSVTDSSMMKPIGEDAFERLVLQGR